MSDAGAAGDKDADGELRLLSNGSVTVHYRIAPAGFLSDLGCTQPLPTPSETATLEFSCDRISLVRVGCLLSASTRAEIADTS